MRWWVGWWGGVQEEGPGGRPSPTLCESKQRVRQVGRKSSEITTEPQICGSPLGRCVGKRRSHLFEICECEACFHTRDVHLERERYVYCMACV